MFDGKRRITKTRWQRENDASRREEGVPSTSALQQALYRTLKTHIDDVIRNQNVSIARGYRNLVKRIELDLAAQTLPSPDARDDPNAKKTMPKWSASARRAELNKAFRVNELDALIKRDDDQKRSS